MSDPRSLLERESRRFIQPDGAFERLQRRRDRKRRNQRIAAGVVGIAVFVAAVWIVTSSGALDRSTPAVPGGSKTGPAQLAVTDDNGFRGWYRLHAWPHQSPGGCALGEYTRKVHVHYVNERVRQFGDPVSDSARLFRYEPGEEFPWRKVHGRRFVLRYDPASNSAVGMKIGHQCHWGIRLVPIG